MVVRTDEMFNMANIPLATMCLNTMNTTLICEYSGIIHWDTKEKQKNGPSALLGNDT